MSITATTGVTSSNSTAATSLACTAFAASTGQDILVAVAIADPTVTVSSIADTAANTYTLIDAQTNTSNLRVELWIASNITANSSNVVTVNLSAASLMTVAVEEYVGLSQGGLTALNRTGWGTTVSDQFSILDGSFAIDGDVNSFWASNGAIPAWIVFDMLATQSFSAITYLPRQDGFADFPGDVEIYVSSDGVTWGTTIATATFASDASLKTLSFTSQSARYLKFNILNAAPGARIFQSCAEFNVGDRTPARAHIERAHTTFNVGNTVEMAQPITYSGDLALGAFAIISNSGDTITGVTGTLRQSLVPALTSVSVALIDNTAAAVLKASLSSTEAWAGVGCNLIGDGTLLSVPVAPNEFDPITSTHQIVLAAAAVTGGGGGGGGPVPVAVNLKGGTTGTLYTEAITVQGGTAPYTFAVTSGSLPTGTSLNASSGVISGTPSTVGSFPFELTVTDATSTTGAQMFSISIVAPSGGGGGSFTFIA